MKKNIDFEYIEDNERLEVVCAELSKEIILAIDIECENNYHHYGTYISLIQISSRTQNYIVDILKITQIKPLKDLLENTTTECIFHDCSFDFRILNSQFDIKPKFLFDTALASTFLNKDEIGLKSLYENYFQVEKEKKFQKADWTKRPLSHDMLQYAIKDTLYLIELKEILEDELKKANLLDYAKQEFIHFENANLEQKDANFDEIKGYSSISDSQRAIFKRLFSLRDKLAQKVDRPIHFVISNKDLIELVQNPPTNVDQIKKLYKVHPIVKSRADRILKQIQIGSKESIELENIDIKRFSEAQRIKFDKLLEQRDIIAHKMNLPPYLILSKDQAKEIVITNTYDSLREWQKEIIKKI